MKNDCLQCAHLKILLCNCKPCKCELSNGKYIFSEEIHIPHFFRVFPLTFIWLSCFRFPSKQFLLFCDLRVSFIQHNSLLVYDIYRCRSSENERKKVKEKGKCWFGTFIESFLNFKMKKGKNLNCRFITTWSGMVN